MTRWIVANVFMTVGLVWIGFYAALRSLFPLTWGGPNIGAGAALALAYAAVAAGLLLGIVDVALSRRTPDADGAPVRSLASWVIPAIVSVVAAVGCLLLVVAPPGNGGDSRVGRIGVTVDAAGGPVLVLVLCSGSVETVTLFGPNQGSTPNATFATLVPPAAVSATTLVPLDDLPAGWSGGPVTLPPDQGSADLVIATAQGAQSTLGQVEFTVAQLSALEPDQVQMSQSGVVGLADISAAVCMPADR